MTDAAASGSRTLVAEPLQPALQHVADAPGHLRGEEVVAMMAQHLGDEERVAGGAALQRPRGVHRRAVELLAGRVARELGDRLGLQPGEVDARDVGLTMQVGQQLDQRMLVVELGRAEGRDDRQPQPQVGGDEVAQEQQRRRVGPLDVVQEQDDGTLGLLGVEQPDGRAEEQIALRVAIGLAGRGRVGQPAAQRADEAAKLAAVLVDVALEDRVGGVLDQVRQRLHERLVGHPQVFVAAALQDRGAAGVGGDGQLASQTRLADARLAAEQDHLPAAVAGVCQQRLQARELRRPADERLGPRDLQPRRQRHDRFGQRIPADLGRGIGPAEAARRLDLQLVAVAQLLPDALVDQDLAGAGQRAEAVVAAGLGRGGDAQHAGDRGSAVVGLDPLLELDGAARRGVGVSERDPQRVAVLADVDGRLGHRHHGLQQRQLAPARLRTAREGGGELDRGCAALCGLGLPCPRLRDGPSDARIMTEPGTWEKVRRGMSGGGVHPGSVPEPLAARHPRRADDAASVVLRPRGVTRRRNAVQTRRTVL